MMNKVSGTKVDMPADMPKRMLPSFTLTSDDLPELKDWKVGGVYFLKVKVEQVSMGKGEMEYMSDHAGKMMHARFQIKALEPIEDKKDFEKEYARNRSNAARP